jgi:hypothetical protein
MLHIVKETKLAVHDASRGTVRAETGTKGIPKCYMAPDDIWRLKETRCFIIIIIITII